jgi:enamine deaminase RidA (YjgF/YER057c/UK114 family)
MNIAAKLSEMGIALPAVAAAVGAYVPTVLSGKLLFVSGQLPWREGKLAVCGKIGRDADVAQAQEGARLAVINALAAIKAQVGDLDQVCRVLRLEVFVNSAAGFTEQAAVANGASNLLQEIFGVAGRHARLAVGVAELPLNAAVELALILEVK